MTDPELPPPLPAPVVEEPRGAWGFWPTMLLGLLALVAMIAAQAFVAAVFAVVVVVRTRGAGGKHLSTDELQHTLLGDPLTLSISVLVSLPVLLAVLWLAIKKRKGPRFSQYLALRKFCPRQFLLWASVLAGVLFGGDRLLQWAGDASGEIFMHDLMDSGKFLGPLAAAVTLAAPLGEELLFRGFMFRGIADSRAGWIAAILIPNVFWVVLHVQYSWPTMAVIFAMGIVLGMARRFSGSVALPIALHFLWNGFATLSVFFDGGPKT